MTQERVYVSANAATSISLHLLELIVHSPTLSALSLNLLHLLNGDEDRSLDYFNLGPLNQLSLSLFPPLCLALQLSSAVSLCDCLSWSIALDTRRVIVCE